MTKYLHYCTCFASNTITKLFWLYFPVQIGVVANKTVYPSQGQSNISKYLLEWHKCSIFNQPDGLLWTFCVHTLNGAVMRVYLMEVEECGQNCPASANLCQRAVCCATAASSNLAQARWKKPLAAHLRLQLEMQHVETEKQGAATAVQATQPGNDVV